MQSKQYELCREVLKRLHDSGVLPHLVLIGSWCMLLYRQYFRKSDFIPAIKTRDMDFAVPVPSSFHGVVDVPILLKDLGFILSYKGEEGYMILQHPELMIEMLVPERGRGHDKPFPLPKLGMNAQALRLLDLAMKTTIHVEFDGIPVIVPHPAVFAIHKLLVSERRTDQAKALRDVEAAVLLMRLLVSTGDTELKRCYESIPKKWQQTVVNVLKTADMPDIIATLSPHVHHPHK